LWPTIINTALGVSSVSKDYIDVARVLEMPGGELQKLSGLPACLYIYWLTNQFGDCLAGNRRCKMLTGGIGIGFFCGMNGAA